MEVGHEKSRRTAHCGIGGFEMLRGGTCGRRDGGPSDVGVLKLQFVIIQFLFTSKEGSKAGEEDARDQVASVGRNKGRDGREDHACEE